MTKTDITIPMSLCDDAMEVFQCSNKPLIFESLSHIDSLLGYGSIKISQKYHSSVNCTLMDAKEKRIEQINSLIKEWQKGDHDSRDALFNLINAEVDKIASIVLRRNQSHLTFVTGDLANEAFIKILQSEQLQIKDHAHLLALSARIMRFILVDRTRQKVSQKHGGNLVTLYTDFGAQGEPDLPAMELDAALTKLSAINPDRAKIVEMRYFGGMTYDEIAVVLGISTTTVKRSWRATRGWLKDALNYD